jgi:hypothetical protein
VTQPEPEVDVPQLKAEVKGAHPLANERD